MVTSRKMLRARDSLMISPCWATILQGGRVFGGEHAWDEALFNRIRMNAIVHLREGALEVPLQLQAVVLVVFKSLKCVGLPILRIRR